MIILDQTCPLMTCFEDDDDESFYTTGIRALHHRWKKIKHIIDLHQLIYIIDLHQESVYFKKVSIDGRLIYLITVRKNPAGRSYGGRGHISPKKMIAPPPPCRPWTFSSSSSFRFKPMKGGRGHGAPSPSWLATPNIVISFLFLQFWDGINPGGGGHFHIEGVGDVPLDRVWFCDHRD